MNEMNEFDIYEYNVLVEQYREVEHNISVCENKIAKVEEEIEDINLEISDLRVIKDNLKDEIMRFEKIKSTFQRHKVALFNQLVKLNPHQHKGESQ